MFIGSSLSLCCAWLCLQIVGGEWFITGCTKAADAESCKKAEILRADEITKDDVSRGGREGVGAGDGRPVV